MTTTAHFSQIIRDQIGVAVLMAAGASDFMYSEADRYLQFTVRGRRGYVTKVRVTLEPSDTYTVAIGRMHKRTFDWEWLGELELVYADSLAEAVRSLYTRHASA